MGYGLHIVQARYQKEVACNFLMDMARSHELEKFVSLLSSRRRNQEKVESMADKGEDHRLE